MRQLVVGDIHGGHKALLQVLERCNYDPYTDQIIFLGDYVDGWSESYEVIETLIELQKVSVHGNIHILGNHDKWFQQWCITGYHSWTHGSANTALSYARMAGVEVDVIPYKVKAVDGTFITANEINISTEVVPEHHLKFLKSLSLFFHDKENNRVFTHAGFNRWLELRQQSTDDIFYWDRDLFFDALARKYNTENRPDKLQFLQSIEEVYIGHTTTLHADTTEPIISENVICMDTGAGFNGKLTIMDVDTKEYWQSDSVKSLYPNEEGR